MSQEQEEHYQRDGGFADKVTVLQCLSKPIEGNQDPPPVKQSPGKPHRQASPMPKQDLITKTRSIPAKMCVSSLKVRPRKGPREKI